MRQSSSGGCTCPPWPLVYILSESHQTWGLPHFLKYLVRGSQCTKGVPSVGTKSGATESNVFAVLLKQAMKMS